MSDWAFSPKGVGFVMLLSPCPVPAFPQLLVAAPSPSLPAAPGQKPTARCRLLPGRMLPSRHFSFPPWSPSVSCWPAFSPCLCNICHPGFFNSSTESPGSRVLCVPALQGLRGQVVLSCCLAGLTKVVLLLGLSLCSRGVLCQCCTPSWLLHGLFCASCCILLRLSTALHRGE